MENKRLIISVGAPIVGDNVESVNGETGVVVLYGTDIETVDGSGVTIKQAIDANASDLSDHEADTSNPHSVTKTQVGLSNVDNTADADKPVSIAQQLALDGKADKINGNTEIKKGNGDELLIKGVSDDSAARMHIEPKGDIRTGTTSKLDLMFDDFESDQTNYRIQNFYTKVGQGDSFNGQNGVAVFGVKGVGDYFGLYPSMNFGYSDDNTRGVPMKLMYFDTSDTEWRTPQLGAWVDNLSVTTGDYILSSGIQYQATTTGVTGTTKPIHTSGTVSDGGVDWLFVRNYADHVNSIRPCVVIGDRDDMPVFGYDNVRMQVFKDILYQTGAKMTHLAGPAYGNSRFEVGNNLNGDSYYFRMFDDTGAERGNVRYSKNGFVQYNNVAVLHNVTVFSGGETTNIDVKNSTLINFNNSSLTNVTKLSGLPYQRITIEAANSNTTLVNGSNIITQDGANITLELNKPIDFLFNSSGSVIREIK